MKDLPPFQFCDETIFQNEVGRMLQNNDWIPREYRAGGFNIYPTFLILKFLSIFTSESFASGQILITGRIFNIIFLNVLSIVITYSLARVFAGVLPSLIVTAIFAFSQFFYMQFWYPDSFIYFGVAWVVLMLSRIQFSESLKVDYRLLGIGYGVAVSTKWTTLTLLIPIMIVLLTKLRRDSFSLKTLNYIASFFLFAFGAILTLNIGILSRFDDFTKGFMFNLQNYGNYPGIRWDGYLFYIASIGLNIFGLFSLPLMVAGVLSLIKNWKEYLFLLSYPLCIVLLLGDKQWVVLRNIASVGPFLIPFLVIGIVTLINFTKTNDFWRKILGQFILIVSFASICLFYFQTFLTYTETDTRVRATDWLRSANLSTYSGGNNEFCSGESPAAIAGLQTIFDPNLEHNLDYYVINSYWNSPLMAKYLTKGILTPFDVNRIHFEQWNSTKLENGFERVKISNSDFPKGYNLVKSFHGNGPDIFVIRKSP
jgi:hypothetical protein